MSKEFQEEAKILGLTGNQLVQKYKKEGKYLEKVKKKVKTCCNCESHSTYIGSNGYECWHVHKCQKKTCTGYLCVDCYTNYQKHDPNSQLNILKSIANCRTGNQNPNSSRAKGDKFEELTSLWKGVKILSKENDHYNGLLDHSIDSEGKRPQTKGRLYDSKRKRWYFGSIERELHKEFDYEICYCASIDGKIIERIYKFPKKEIMKNIAIYKNPMNTRGTGPIIPWYDKYRITDEETIKKVNDIWKKILK